MKLVFLESDPAVIARFAAAVIVKVLPKIQCVRLPVLDTRRLGKPADATPKSLTPDSCRAAPVPPSPFAPRSAAVHPAFVARPVWAGRLHLTFDVHRPVPLWPRLQKGVGPLTEAPPCTCEDRYNADTASKDCGPASSGQAAAAAFETF